MLGQYTTITTHVDTGTYITVSETKNYLRIPSSQTSEDTMIEMFIATSMRRIEELTDVQLAPTKTVNQTINIIAAGKRITIPFRFPASLRTNEAFTDKDGNPLPASATEIFPTEFEIDTSVLQFPYLKVSYDLTESKAAILKPAVMKVVSELYANRGDAMEDGMTKALLTHRSLINQFRERTVML